MKSSPTDGVARKEDRYHTELKICEFCGLLVVKNAQMLTRR